MSITQVNERVRTLQAVLGNTPLHHSMVVRDSASAEAIWGDGTSF